MNKKPVTSNRQANYALGILFVVLMLNLLDRQIITILAELIKEEMGLSDKQIGLMTGLSFAIFYSTLAIPIAALADRWNRSRIISISVAIWSVMTMLSGTAVNFVQLLLARVGVGIGEAGSTPASHSLISDLFPPERRATALGILGMAVPIGSFIAFTAGGWMAENIGWRAALLVAGLPGLIIAALLWFTVREPRGQTSLIAALKPRKDEVTLREAVAELWTKPAYWHLVAAGVVILFVGFGIGTFYAGLFVRVHGLGYQELGWKLGVMMLVFGSFGSWFGGKFGDFINSRVMGGALLASALALLIAIPGIYFAVYAESANIALVLFGIPTIAFTFYYGPTFSTIQSLASDRTRALATAIWLFFSSLVGVGLGPLFVGFLSDMFAAGDPSLSGPALQKALTIIALFNVWSAFHLWRAQVYFKKGDA